MFKSMGLLVLAAAVTITMVPCAGVASAKGGGSSKVVLQATLTGTVVGKARAKYQASTTSAEKQLEVEAEAIQLAVGTSLTVSVGGTVVGSMNVVQTATGRKASLRLNSRLGTGIPAVVPATTVQIHAGGTLVAWGAF